MVVSQAKQTAGWDVRRMTTGSMTSRTSHSIPRTTTDQESTGHLWEKALPPEELDLLAPAAMPVQPGHGAVGQPARVEDERVSDSLGPAVFGRARDHAQGRVVAVDEVAADPGAGLPAELADRMKEASLDQGIG